MTTTPKSSQEDAFGDSWVHLSAPGSETSTPLGSIHNGDMQRLLWEAQRESNQSSARVSCASSRRESPKSPPNSPNVELSLGEELKGVYINYNKEDFLPIAKSSDWVWDWSSRPDQQPPKEWKFRHPKRVCLSMRHSKAMKSGIFSTEVLSVMLLTNLVSLLLGAGVGFYLGKKLTPVTTFAMD